MLNNGRERIIIASHIEDDRYVRSDRVKGVSWGTNALLLYPKPRPTKHGRQEKEKACASLGIYQKIERPDRGWHE